MVGLALDEPLPGIDEDTGAAGWPHIDPRPV